MGPLLKGCSPLHSPFSLCRLSSTRKSKALSILNHGMTKEHFYFPNIKWVLGFHSNLTERKKKWKRNTGILPVNTIAQTWFYEILKADPHFQSCKAFKNMPIPGKGLWMLLTTDRKKQTFHVHLAGATCSAELGTKSSQFPSEAKMCTHKG